MLVYLRSTKNGFYRTHVFPFQGLKSCSEEMRADEDYMTALWQHELTRVVKDRLCRDVDIKWFEKTLKATIKEVTPSLLRTSPFLSLIAKIVVVVVAVVVVVVFRSC